MHSPVERKFNEYLGNIHTLLSMDAYYLEDPSFINNLLDKMEFIKRNFILMSAEKEDVFIYQGFLERLSTFAEDTRVWVENYKQFTPERHPGYSSLKENLFLLSDLFCTSRNLINSFYPVN
jgi:hypothetical protein